MSNTFRPGNYSRSLLTLGAADNDGARYYQSKRPRNSDGNDSDEGEYDDEEDEDEGLFQSAKPEPQPDQTPSGASQPAKEVTEVKEPGSELKNEAVVAKTKADEDELAEEAAASSVDGGKAEESVVPAEEEKKADVFKVEQGREQEEEEPLSEDEGKQDPYIILNLADDEEKTEEPKDEIACQYEKVQRSKQRFKCQLKDVIMHIKGNDYVVRRVTAEIEY